MKSIALVIFLLCTPIAAQQSNFHGGGQVGLTSNLGITGPAYGATVGGDVRVGRVAFSADGDVLTIRKEVGGSGYQVNARGTLRYYAASKFFVQGGGEYQHYKVEAFNKSTAQVIVGGGYGDDKQVLEVNYRHDLNSENALRIIESRYTVYLKRHVFARGSVAVAFVRTGIDRSAGGAASIAVGLYF